MSGPIITYVQHSNTAPQSELSALAAVYRIVLTAKQKGRLPDECGPDDGTEVKEDSANVYRST
jgi:hypothetical protein